MARVKLTEKEILEASKACAKDVLGEVDYKKNKDARDSIMKDFKTGALWAEVILLNKIKKERKK